MDTTTQRTRRQLPYLRVGMVLLLMAIAGLSTVAKTSQYNTSRSGSDHFLNISTKMKVSQFAVAVVQPSAVPVVPFISPQPKTKTRVADINVAEIPSIAISLSLRHRSPPPSLAYSVRSVAKS
jgi:hypothetical protein